MHTKSSARCSSYQFTSADMKALTYSAFSCSSVAWSKLFGGILLVIVVPQYHQNVAMLRLRSLNNVCRTSIFICLGPRFIGFLPQIHCRVGSPGPPGFGSLGEFAVVVHRCATQQTQIAGGECIRFTQRAHGNVLSGPFTDTWKLAKTCLKLIDVLNRAKDYSAFLHRTRQSAN